MDEQKPSKLQHVDGPEESDGDLRRVAISQTLVKDYQLIK